MIKLITVCGANCEMSGGGAAVSSAGHGGGDCGGGVGGVDRAGSGITHLDHGWCVALPKRAHPLLFYKLLHAAEVAGTRAGRGLDRWVGVWVGGCAGKWLRW